MNTPHLSKGFYVSKDTLLFVFKDGLFNIICLAVFPRYTKFSTNKVCKHETTFCVDDYGHPVIPSTIHSL